MRGYQRPDLRPRGTKKGSGPEAENILPGILLLQIVMDANGREICHCVSPQHFPRQEAFERHVVLISHLLAPQSTAWTEAAMAGAFHPVQRAESPCWGP